MPTYEYPRPAVTVDLVILTLVDEDLKVLLVRRGRPPFEGMWALPGGFVRSADGPEEWGESLLDAARRELEEETGLQPEQVYLEQLYTFGRPDRDPSQRVVTVAWYALVRPDLAPLVRPGGDVNATKWVSLGEVAALAYDHREILDTAVERIRGKVDYSDIAFELVPETFTVSELRAVHEVVKGTTYDPGNFRRRFLRMQTDGILEPAPGRRRTGKRPAQIYRFRGRS